MPECRCRIDTDDHRKNADMAAKISWFLKSSIPKGNKFFLRAVYLYNLLDNLLTLYKNGRAGWIHKYIDCRLEVAWYFNGKLQLSFPLLQLKACNSCATHESFLSLFFFIFVCMNSRSLLVCSIFEARVFDSGNLESFFAENMLRVTP